MVYPFAAFVNRADCAAKRDCRKRVKLISNDIFTNRLIYVDLYPSKFFYEAQSQFAIIDILLVYLAYILLEIHAISIWDISTFNIQYLCCTIIAVDTHI